MAPQQRVLVVGAGIAGSTLAYFLARSGFRVVVAERSKSDQSAGQGIEIEEPALQVVKRMSGVLEQIKARRTGEMGFALVDDRGRMQAKFGEGFASPTGNLEIMRGDLTGILYKAADSLDGVEYRFETTIKALKQIGSAVAAELELKTDRSVCTEEFDFVIGADGVKSRTRALAMGPPEKLNCYKPIGSYTAYFSIKSQPHDWPLSRLCHFPGRRVIWIRPVGEHSPTTSVYLVHLSKYHPALHAANISGDRKLQKEAFADVFKGLGWEAPRVIDEMLKTDNFYSDELEQVRLERWSQDRVALVGDSAWAPTPMTGQGTQLALIGAWVLAQEMARDPTASAFQTYEKRLRPFVEKCQQIPLNGRAPRLLVPETSWGIAIVRNTMWLLSKVTAAIAWVGLEKYFPDQDTAIFDLQMDKEGEKDV